MEKLESRLELCDSRLSRVRDVDERGARDRARVERLEKWRDGEVAEALGKLGFVEKSAQLASDCVQRLRALEEAQRSMRASAAEASPARVAKMELKLAELARGVEEHFVSSRERLRSSEVAYVDSRESDAQRLAQLTRAVEECARVSSEAAEDARRATYKKAAEYISTGRFPFSCPIYLERYIYPESFL